MPLYRLTIHVHPSSFTTAAQGSRRVLVASVLWSKRHRGNGGTVSIKGALDTYL
jgi:hypothetical protein